MAAAYAAQANHDLNVAQIDALAGRSLTRTSKMSATIPAKPQTAGRST